MPLVLVINPAVAQALGVRRLSDLLHAATAPGLPGGAFTVPSRHAFSVGWYFLSGVDVLAPRRTGAVVAFGDSITDGFQVTGEGPLEDPAAIDKNARYPDFLVDEVLPFIEQRYRVRTDAAGRGLGGSSAGGIGTCEPSPGGALSGA